MNLLWRVALAADDCLDQCAIRFLVNPQVPDWEGYTDCAIHCPQSGGDQNLIQALWCVIAQHHTTLPSEDDIQYFNQKLIRCRAARQSDDPETIADATLELLHIDLPPDDRLRSHVIGPYVVASLTTLTARTLTTDQQRQVFQQVLESARRNATMSNPASDFAKLGLLAIGSELAANPSQAAQMRNVIEKSYPDYETEAAHFLANIARITESASEQGSFEAPIGGSKNPR